MSDSGNGEDAEGAAATDAAAPRTRALPPSPARISVIASSTPSFGRPALDKLAISTQDAAGIASGPLAAAFFTSPRVRGGVDARSAAGEGVLPRV
jgi:hypothetical protein